MRRLIMTETNVDSNSIPWVLSINDNYDGFLRIRIGGASTGYFQMSIPQAKKLMRYLNDYLMEQLEKEEKEGDTK